MLCIFQKNGIDKLHLLNNLIEFCLDYSVVFNDAVCYGLPILNSKEDNTYTNTGIGAGGIAPLNIHSLGFCKSIC